MSLSLIIPTLDRPDDLIRCLKSVASGIRLPDEIIIVEQGNVVRTREIAESFTPKLNICVEALTDKSLTKARNVGVTRSRGAIIAFIDDDVELMSDYLEICVSYLNDHPNTLGIVGRDLEHPRTLSLGSFVRRALNMMFCGASFFGPSRIRRSGYNILQNFSSKEETVEWLSGCSTVRRSVFDEGFRYNERFIRWALGEDALFSYQIYKKYPRTLRYLPQLRFHHYESPSSRLPNHHKLRMKIIYKYIFWKEEVYGNSVFNFICWFWMQVGMVFFELSKSPRLETTRTLIETYSYLLFNFKKIDIEDINYNEFILKA